MNYRKLEIPKITIWLLLGFSLIICWFIFVKYVVPNTEAIYLNENFGIMGEVYAECGLHPEKLRALKANYRDWREREHQIREGVSEIFTTTTTAPEVKPKPKKYY